MLCSASHGIHPITESTFFQQHHNSCSFLFHRHHLHFQFPYLYIFHQTATMISRINAARVSNVSSLLLSSALKTAAKQSLKPSTFVRSLSNGGGRSNLNYFQSQSLPANTVVRLVLLLDGGCRMLMNLDSFLSKQLGLWSVWVNSIGKCCSHATMRVY